MPSIVASRLGQLDALCRRGHCIGRVGHRHALDDDLRASAHLDVADAHGNCPMETKRLGHQDNDKGCGLRAAGACPRASGAAHTGAAGRVSFGGRTFRSARAADCEPSGRAGTLDRRATWLFGPRGARHLVFTIRMQGEGETVFFDL